MAKHLLLLTVITIFSFSPKVECSFWDSLPFVSQAKSLVQVIAGDEEGAKQTQINFSRGIFVAPVRGVVEHTMGNHEEAKETWKYYGKQWEGLVDSVPVVGHVKGGIHYAAGDRVRGDEIMKSATRPIGVIAGGAAGLVVTGGNPAGAVAGGIAGGVAMDGAITGIESAINKEYVPYGSVSGVTNIVKGNASVGEIVDTGLGVVGDGIGGYSGGNLVTSIRSAKVPSSMTNLVRCRRGLGAGCTRPAGQGTIFEPKAPPPAAPRPISTYSSSGSSTTTGGGGSLSSISTNVNSPRISVQSLPAPNTPINLPVSHVQPHILTGPLNSLPILIKEGVQGLKKIKIDVGTGSSAAIATKLGTLAIVGHKSDVATNSQATESESDDEDKKKTCDRQPEIQHRDESAMADCVGKRAGEKCRVRCERDHEPTEPEVTCVQRGTSAAWDLGGVRCEPTTAVVCRDNNNRPVDWFIMYKLPKRAPVEGFPFPRGGAFLFMSPRGIVNPTAGGSYWEEVGWGPIDNTMRPLQQEDTRRGLHYAVYSDQPPRGFVPEASSNFAHAKGVFANKDGTGFYMPHSLPKFPSVNGGRSAHSDRYGQMFMCVTLASPQAINTVAGHIRAINANIYQQNLFTPGNLRNNRNTIRSRSYQEFTLFSKPASLQQDIWKDMIGEWYGEDLFVLSWMSGRGQKLEPVCPAQNSRDQGKLAVENVEQLRYTTDLDFVDVSASSRRTQEHAKWGVGKGMYGNVFCIGDLNRMESQMDRPGGALCFWNFSVADTFREMVSKTDCSPNNVEPRSGFINRLAHFRNLFI